MGSLGRSARDMIRITIGLFPPMSKAELKIYFHQKLEFEDLSYSLRVPKTLIPRYISDVHAIAKSILLTINPDSNSSDVNMIEEQKDSLI